MQVVAQVPPDGRSPSRPEATWTLLLESRSTPTTRTTTWWLATTARSLCATTSTNTWPWTAGRRSTPTTRRSPASPSSPASRSGNRSMCGAPRSAQRRSTRPECSSRNGCLSSVRYERCSQNVQVFMWLDEHEQRYKSLKTLVAVLRSGAVGYQEDVLPAHRHGFVSHSDETHIHSGGVPGLSVHTTGGGTWFSSLFIYLFVLLPRAILFCHFASSHPWFASCWQTLEDLENFADLVKEVTISACRNYLAEHMQSSNTGARTPTGHTCSIGCSRAEYGLLPASITTHPCLSQMIRTRATSSSRSRRPFTPAASSGEVTHTHPQTSVRVLPTRSHLQHANSM